MSSASTDRRWLALVLLAAAQFVVVLDASIVNVALPSIGTALDFSQDNLSWVVNAYTLTFGGFLLLGGRMADLLGRRRMFIAGLILQVAPAAEVYVVKVLDSHGVGDDAAIAAAMEQLPQDIDIVNLSLGGYTDGDQPPMAIALAMQSQTFNSRVVVAAAGNHAEKRPFWPAAFGPVVSVGAVEDKEGLWAPASYSNHGAWVDLVARGSNLQSTFAHETTKVAQGPVADAFSTKFAGSDLGWLSALVSVSSFTITGFGSLF